MIRAIAFNEPGPPTMLRLVERIAPQPGPHDLLVRVRAAGVNRADCLQRAGTYPTPKGVTWSDIPGLELAGEVIELGAEVQDFAIGDRVFGLVAGGAYAEQALLDHRLALPVPEGMDFIQAAGIIEVFATANETVFQAGGLQSGETLLVHAGASGVGTAALQMAKAIGCNVFATAGSPLKVKRLQTLGVDLAINYKSQEFVAEILAASNGEGVDVIEDFIGADYLMRNLAALRPLGRLVLVGLMGASECTFDPAMMLSKRLTIRGFTLRSQSILEKQAIVTRVRERWMPFITAGTIGPILHTTLPLEEAAQAHRLLESDTTIGKIILSVN